MPFFCFDLLSLLPSQAVMLKKLDELATSSDSKNFLYFTNIFSTNTFLAEVAHRHLRSLKSSKTPMVR